MQIDEAECRRRLAEERFAVLGTTNRDGSPHLVPVVFVLMDDRIGIPTDRVKAKRTIRLRRFENLAERPLASLLTDHRSDDWNELWWVRADLSATGGDGWWMRDAFAERYAAYREPGTIASIVELAIDRITGWQAG